MKKIFLVVFSLIFIHGFAEAGEKILAIQSMSIEPYEKAFEGFKSVVTSRIEKIFLSDSEERDIQKQIKNTRPDLILAIGKDALSIATASKNIPVVYAMVLNPETLLSGQENIRGINMTIKPQSQLAALLKIVPGIKRIGVIYDPDKSGHFVTEAQNATARMGLRLIAKQVKTSKDVPMAMMDIREHIDSFWMVPDTTVITPETVDFLFLLSFEKNIPVLTFSEKYLSLGALIAASIDPFDMGVQAGEMAKQFLMEGGAKDARQAHARKMVVSTNVIIAEKLGINLNIASSSKTTSDKTRIRTVVDIN